MERRDKISGFQRSHENEYISHSSHGQTVTTLAMPSLSRHHAVYHQLLPSAVWLILVGCGLIALFRYEKAPGPPEVSPQTWPRESRLSRDPLLPTLVLFAHPRCPCTRATVGELALLLARVSGKVTCTVVFMKPPLVAEDWMETDLWRSAKAIPGVTVVRDESGVEANRFGAKTSGYALLYARDEKLLFQGGITDGRGHAGESAGRGAIIASIEGKLPALNRTQTFGCPLFAKSAAQPDHSECPR